MTHKLLNGNLMNQSRFAGALVRTVSIFSAVLLSQPVLAQDKPRSEREFQAAWRTDLVAFESHLKKLTAAGRTPTKEEFSAKPDEEVNCITDGAGGLIDLTPGKDTMQFRVNEALKGKTIRWEFELGRISAMGGGVMVIPKSLLPAHAERKEIPFLNTIQFKKHAANLPETELKPGHRVVLEATIGDSSKNGREPFSFHGATAIHHLQGVAHPIFWLGLDEVTITRVDPTSE